MDLNVWITAILSIVGTLLGVIVGAWLNPLMQEWKDERKLKKFIAECDDVEQFVIFRAYKTTCFYMDIIRLINTALQKEPHNYILSDCSFFLMRLREIIHRFNAENILFAQKDDEEYTISLRSNVKFLVNDNPNIKNKLIKATKKVITDEFFKYYEAIFAENFFQTPDADKRKLFTKFVFFMNDIEVFECYKKDLSYLNFNNSQSYLQFPKGKFHPEFKDN